MHLCTLRLPGPLSSPALGVAGIQQLGEGRGGQADAQCRVGTTMERVESKRDTLLRRTMQPAAADASAAQPVLKTKGEALASLQATMKRGLESVLEAVQDVHSAVQDVESVSKKQSVESTPYPAPPQY